MDPMAPSRITWSDVSQLPDDGKRYEAIGGDGLLVWRATSEEIVFVRTGTHDDLFGRGPTGAVSVQPGLAAAGMDQYGLYGRNPAPAGREGASDEKEDLHQPGESELLGRDP